jgi:signal peptidase
MEYHNAVSADIARKGENMKSFWENNRLFLIVLAVLLLLLIRYDRYYIRTGSMEPEYPVGTLVLIDHYRKPEVGDVYAYRTGDTVVIHRVIAITEDGYVFQGDANGNPDSSLVLQEQLIGKVVWKIPWLSGIYRRIGHL